MGLMDKFKNLFTDEEVIEEDEDYDVEIKEIKKEEPRKLPTFMREKLAKEEKNKEISQKEKIDEEDEIEIPKEINLENNITEEIKIDNDKEVKQKFKFPIDFNESDFTETRESRQNLHAKERKEQLLDEEKAISYDNILKEPNLKSNLPPKKEPKVSELYKDKREENKKESKKFRATPIISPIYGVLVKNYNPEEVEHNKGRNLEDTRPSKNIDFDSVRKKAYGNISEEIKENLLCENCEYLKEVKDCKKKHQHEIEEVEYNNEYNNITLDEATENYYDYGVEYEKKKTSRYQDDDLDDYKVDKEEPYYLDDDEDTVEIINHEDVTEPTRKNEIPPVKSSINLLSALKKSMGDEPEPKKEKNLELTDDLFNLIDSMYDERNDDK